MTDNTSKKNDYNQRLLLAVKMVMDKYGKDYAVSNHPCYHVAPMVFGNLMVEFSQAELKEKEAEIGKLKSVVKNSGFHFWAKTKGWIWHQNGYFYQLDYASQWPAPRVKEDFELRPEFEKEYGLENIYFNPKAIGRAAHTM